MLDLYVEALTKLRNKLNKGDKSTLEVMAIDAALRESNRLAEARFSLKRIFNLTCLDGNKYGCCFQENCPRCIAKDALELLRESGD